MCCGQGRAQLRTATQARTPSSSVTRAARVPERVAAHSVPSGASVDTSAVSIRYIDKTSVRVQGLHTGRSYEFSVERPTQDVDARDAASLLNTRYFRRA